MVKNEPQDRIFYDGDCGVCHWSVDFVARRDTSNDFRFAPLQGETFENSVDEETRRTIPDSMVVQTLGGDVLLRSAGVVYILSRLSLGWRLLGRLIAVVPRPIRDFFYDRFAANRSRLASKPDGVCPLMPPELARRFDP